MQESKLTLVLQEVTHPRPPCQDQLGHVLYDLRLLLLRHRLEPFREADLACRLVSLERQIVQAVHSCLVVIREECS